MSNSPTYRRAVEWIEDDASRRHGLSLKRVRPIVAREIGVPPGTLENIRNGRTKGLRGWIERKIDDALVRALRRESARIDHELAVAMARRVAADRGEVAALLAERADVAALIAAAPDNDSRPGSDGLTLNTDRVRS